MLILLPRQRPSLVWVAMTSILSTTNDNKNDEVKRWGWKFRRGSDTNSYVQPPANWNPSLQKIIEPLVQSQLHTVATMDWKAAMLYPAGMSLRRDSLESSREKKLMHNCSCHAHLFCICIAKNWLSYNLQFVQFQVLSEEWECKLLTCF